MRYTKPGQSVYSIAPSRIANDSSQYTAIDRREAIQPAFDLLYGIVDEIFPIEVSAIESAKTLVLGYRQLSARDALHVAVMQEHGVDRIMSFDRGFDAIPGLRRLGE